MAKVKDKNFKVIKYDDEKPSRKVLFILIAVAAVALISVTGYLLLAPSGNAPGVRGDSPDAMVRAYGEFVGPYVPPSGLSPTQTQVSEWLQFHDRQSQQWFRQNAATLAFLTAGRDADTWKSWNTARREMEGLKYLLSQSPFRGGVVNNIRNDEANNRAFIELKSREQITRFEVVKESGGWRFNDMMGQRERLDQTVRAVTLP